MKLLAIAVLILIGSGLIIDLLTTKSYGKSRKTKRKRTYRKINNNS